MPLTFRVLFFELFSGLCPRDAQREKHPGRIALCSRLGRDAGTAFLRVAIVEQRRESVEHGIPLALECPQGMIRRHGGVEVEDGEEVGSSDKFDLGQVQGEEFEEEEGLVAIAVGAAGKGFGSVVNPFRFACAQPMFPPVEDAAGLSQKGCGHLAEQATPCLGKIMPTRAPHFVWQVGQKKVLRAAWTILWRGVLQRRHG